MENEVLETEVVEEQFDKIEQLDINNKVKSSFLNYAMSVIIARALPDVRDGLKPVQRRILYGMNELKIYSNVAHKKSARIVGDVMGKYHPHGDSSIYEAMVRMAQPFSYRYTLVDGHGNFGNIDGDGAAAMRYTEARMSKIAMEMLRDIDKNTVNFSDNYDATEIEPNVLPSRYPNLLVNGSTGIAVGMATNIPPHNLGEVIDGVIAVIHNPEITSEELMEYIPGPDFPTGGMVLGRTGLRNAYTTGNGSITIRSKTEIVQLKNGKHEILVTEIPYAVNKTRLIERIAEVAKNKIVEGITDLRDESGRDGIKIVIELRKDVNPEVMLNNLEYTVFTDIKCISYILEQIINNAIKYSKQKGKIEFSARDIENGVVFSIKDYGIGIEPEDIRRVFDKGFTGINGRNRLYKSTGMGLYFAKNMIDKLGHKIEVSSKKDEYTIFNIYFYDISDYLSN